MLVYLILAVIALIVAYMYTQQKSSVPETKNVKTAERFNNEFYIYNYLLKPIVIKIDENGEISPFIDRIEPKSNIGMKFRKSSQYLKKGNIVKVFYIDNNGDEVHFSDYSLDIPEDTTIKMLHIGMVTSRWVGATQDSTFKPGLNAVQGRPWIKIHNLTDEYLSLNDSIDISPGGMLRYSGRDHFGVRLGTIFKDRNGVFPDYIFTIPATDLYYGITSDIQQSLFGGFQIDEKFYDEEEEPQFLLENGWMGGPANGSIEPKYLPKEGNPLKYANKNRWGEVL